MCKQVCKSKSGLTRHMKSKHADKNTITVSKIPRKQDFSPEVILEEFIKSAQKISASDLYDENWREAAKQLSSQSINLTLLCEEINKLNFKTDEKFTSEFFGKIVIDAQKFLQAEDPQFAVEIFTTMTPLLLGRKK